MKMKCLLSYMTGMQLRVEITTEKLLSMFLDMGEVKAFLQ